MCMHAHLVPGQTLTHPPTVWWLENAPYRKPNVLEGPEHSQTKPKAENLHSQRTNNMQVILGMQTSDMHNLFRSHIHVACLRLE